MTARFTLRIGKETVLWARSGGSDPIAEEAHDGPDSVPDAVQSLCEQHGVGRGARAEVELEPPCVQLRTLTRLPPVGDRELATLVSTQSAKFFRLNGSRAITDAVWLQRDDEVKAARAAAVSAEWLSGLIARAEAAGVRVVGVFVSADGLPRPLRLDPPQVRLARRRASARHMAALACAAAGAWAVAGGVYVGDLVLDRFRIRSELEALEEPMARIQQVRARIREFRPTAAVLAGQGPEGAWATESLAGLAEALPRWAFLKSLDLRRDGEVRMVAVVRDPPDLVRRISALRPRSPSLESPLREVDLPQGPWYEIEVSMGNRR